MPFRKHVDDDNSIRSLDKLFENGSVLKASMAELENAIVEIANQVDQSQTIQNRNLIRGLIITNIQNQKHIDNANNLNIVFTIVIIFLTLINVYISIQVANYTEVQSRSDRILQAEATQRAITFCEKSPDSQDSGLRYLSNGAPTPCSEVLKQYK